MTRRADTTCSHHRLRRRYLGVDPGGGRFGEVHLETCRGCGASFVHYQWEIEGISRSGRWHRGRLDEDQAARLTAENAAEILAALPEYVSGGSYYDGHVGPDSGPI